MPSTPPKRDYKRTDPTTGKKYKATSPKGKELFRKQQLAKCRAIKKVQKKVEKKEKPKNVDKSLAQILRVACKANNLGDSGSSYVLLTRLLAAGGAKKAKKASKKPETEPKEKELYKTSMVQVLVKTKRVKNREKQTGLDFPEKLVKMKRVKIGVKQTSFGFSQKIS